MAQVTKHLALNVPVDFDAHVKYAMAAIISEARHPRINEPTPEFFVERYRRSVTAALKDAENHPGAEQIAADLSGVESRFIALLNTIDQSVKVNPLYRNYSRISRSIKPRLPHPTNRPNDPDIVENYTANVLGYDTPSEIPHTIEDFRSAETLAEKALIARLLTEEYSQLVDEIASHFDYKNQAFGRGAPPTFALTYCVSALALVFEKWSDRGTNAVINANEPPRVTTGLFRGVRYTGYFLDFVETFMAVADTGTRGMNPTQGFFERVRKIAHKRKQDPTFSQLLHQEETDVEIFLEFLDRAQHIKP